MLFWWSPSIRDIDVPTAQARNTLSDVCRLFVFRSFGIFNFSYDPKGRRTKKPVLWFSGLGYGARNGFMRRCIQRLQRLSLLVASRTCISRPLLLRQLLLASMVSLSYKEQWATLVVLIATTHPSEFLAINLLDRL